AELSGSRANPLPDAFVHIVALAECEVMNREVHGDNDSTIGCVGVFRSSAVALSLLPERALPFGLGRPEPAVIRRREARGAKRVQRAGCTVQRTAAQRPGEQEQPGATGASHDQPPLMAAALCLG